MSSALNKGQINVGGTSKVSYGNQSPAVDAVPLAWLAGDIRYNLDNVVNNILVSKWVCVVSGTPGVWIEVDVPSRNLQLQTTFCYNMTPSNNGDPYTAIGGAYLMAPATDDWSGITLEPTVIRNLVPIPNVAQLQAGRASVYLDVFLVQNEWTTPVANGLVFSVFDQTTAVIGTGSIDAAAGTTGKYTPVGVSGLTLTATALGVSLLVNAGVGASVAFAMMAVLSVYNENTLG